VTLDEMIAQLQALRENGVPGSAEVLRYQAGDGENYRDTDESIWNITVHDYTNHAPDVVIS